MVLKLQFQNLPFVKCQFLAEIKGELPDWVYVSASLNPGASGARCQRAYLIKRSLWALKTRVETRGSELRLQSHKHGRGAPPMGTGASRSKAENQLKEFGVVGTGDKGETL